MCAAACARNFNNVNCSLESKQGEKESQELLIAAYWPKSFELHNFFESYIAVVAIVRNKNNREDSFTDLSRMGHIEHCTVCREDKYVSDHVTFQIFFASVDADLPIVSFVHKAFPY